MAKIRFYRFEIIIHFINDVILLQNVVWAHCYSL